MGPDLNIFDLGQEPQEGEGAGRRLLIRVIISLVAGVPTGVTSPIDENLDELIARFSLRYF